MTCIVGYVEENGDVIIASDTRVCYGHLKRSVNKVFRKNNLLFGLAGMLRQSQIIQYNLVIPEHPRGISDMEYMCHILGDAIRDKIKECDAFHIQDGNPDMNTHGLVGYNGELYFMSSDLAFVRTRDDYEACGSGQEFALGALAAMERDVTLSAKDKVVESIKIAARYSNSVNDSVDVQILKR